MPVHDHPGQALASTLGHHRSLGRIEREPLLTNDRGGEVDHSLGARPTGGSREGEIVGVISSGLFVRFGDVFEGSGARPCPESGGAATSAAALFHFEHDGASEDRGTLGDGRAGVGAGLHFLQAVTI